MPEGIGGHEAFRDLGLLYFAEVDPGTGKLATLRMRPMQMKRFQLEQAAPADAAWLKETLSRVSSRFGVQIDLAEDGSVRRPSAAGELGKALGFVQDS